MTPTEFGKIIKEDMHGVFLFYGEEQYLKQHYFSIIKKKIRPDDDDSVSISGEDLTLTELGQRIMDIASMPSMDMNTRLVIVYDINWNLAKLDKDKEKDNEDLAFFESCLTELSSFDDTVVIIDTRPEYFNAGTEKKPSKLLERLNKVLSSVAFAKETPAKLAVWVQKHFSAHKLNASPAVCNYIITYCGRDMTTLNHEITKLAAYVLQKGGDTVTENDVRTVSSSVNEIETFDFSNAILSGNSERAFSILSDMRLHKEKPELIMGSIISVYNNLYTVKTLLDAGMMLPEIVKTTGMREYQAQLYTSRASRLGKKGLEKAMELCREADIKIKSRNIDCYDTIDILLIKLSMTDKIR